MAKLPVYTNERSIDTGSGFFRPTSAADDTGRAASRFGANLGQLGSVLAKQEDYLDTKNKAEQEAFDKVKVERAYIEQHTASNERVKAAAANLDPSDPNFYDKFKLENDKAWDETFKSLNLSGPLADAHELKFKRGAMIFNEQAAGQASVARQKYVKDTMTKIGTTYADAVVNGSYSRDDARSSAAASIIDMGLPPDARAAVEKHTYSLIDAAYAQRYAQSNGALGYRELRGQLSTSLQNDPTGARGKMVETSERYGLDPKIMLMIASRENGNHSPTLKNPNSTAYGLFQFIDGDWKETGIEKTADPAMQIEAMARRLTRLKAGLESVGLDLTPQHVYGSHLMGQAGYMALVRTANANPDADAKTVYASVAGSTIARKAFSGSNGALLVDGATVADTLTAINNYANKGGSIAEGILASPRVAPDPNAPVTLGGVKLDNLTRRDAQVILSKSLEAARQDADAYSKAAFKQRYDIGILNSQDRGDREAINKLDREAGTGDRILSGDPDAYSAQRTFARQHQMVSANVSAAATKMMESPDPGVKLRGYELLREVHNADPLRGLENSAVDGEHRARAVKYTTLVNSFGLNRSNREPSVEEARSAISRVEAAITADKDDRRNGETFKQDIKDRASNRTFAELHAAAGETSSTTSGWWKTITFGAVGGNATVPAPNNANVTSALEAKYREFFVEHYKQTGGGSDNEKIAAAAAQTDMKRLMSVTKVMGHEQVTPYAPELVLPQKSGSHAWVGKQVMDAIAINESRLNKERSLSGQRKPPEAKDVFIRGDADTGADFRAGRTPSYLVTYTDSKGQLTVLPDRWRPDLDTAGIAAEQAAGPPPKVIPRQAAPATAPATGVAAARAKRVEREGTGQATPQYNGVPITP